jgi:hypothetical protein
MMSENAEESGLPLQELIQRIEANVNGADAQILAAALLYREARRRVEAGEEGAGVKWMEWAVKNIKLKSSRLYELEKIADSDDPAAELDVVRASNRERQKRYREKATARENTSDPERVKLSKWAKDAPIDQVRSILTHVQRLPAVMPAALAIAA